MNQKIHDLRAKYRYSVILLKELVRTEFKLRYQNSILGYLWSLLKPFALFLIVYVVFVRIVKTGGDLPHIGTYILLGIVMWNFFIEVTTGSIAAIVGRGDLLRKVNFPRYVVILAGAVSALINLALSLVVVAVFMVINSTDISSTVVFVPLLFAELFVFALALAFLLSALFVRYRDVSFVWEVMMQGAFFATPIMYDFSLVTDASNTLAKILISNPVAQIMQDTRHALVTQQTLTTTDVFGTPWARLIPLGIVVLTLILSARYFRRRAPYFAEEV